MTSPFPTELCPVQTHEKSKDHNINAENCHVKLQKPWQKMVYSCTVGPIGHLIKIGFQGLYKNDLNTFCTTAQKLWLLSDILFHQTSDIWHIYGIKVIRKGEWWQGSGSHKYYLSLHNLSSDSHKYPWPDNKQIFFCIFGCWLNYLMFISVSWSGWVHMEKDNVLTCTQTLGQRVGPVLGGWTY